MKTSAPRAISSRSIVLRTNGPAVDERAEAQLCSCAMTTGTRASLPEQRAPDVRAELVRMEDVDAVSQVVEQGAPGGEVGTGAAIEPHDLDPGGAQVVLEGRLADGTRRTEDALEAAGVQPHGHRDGHPLASATDIGVVEESDDSEPLRTLAPAH